MPGPVSDSAKGTPDDAPCVPSWCYRHGHHEGYHGDDGACLLAHRCGCSGLPQSCLTPLEDG